MAFTVNRLAVVTLEEVDVPQGDRRTLSPGSPDALPRLRSLLPGPTMPRRGANGVAVRALAPGVAGNACYGQARSRTLHIYIYIYIYMRVCT